MQFPTKKSDICFANIVTVSCVSSCVYYFLTVSELMIRIYLLWNLICENYFRI